MSNIISNHDFSQGLQSWNPISCQAHTVSAQTNPIQALRPLSGHSYAVATQRRELWHGIEQDITAKVSAGKKFNVLAQVGVSGNFRGSCGVQATLRLENFDSGVVYQFVGRVAVSGEKWERLEGSFCLSRMPKRVVFYLEGPGPGVDLLVDSVTITSEEAIILTSNPESSYQSAKKSEDILHGNNIIRNCTFSKGLTSWSSLGSCTLSVQTDSQLSPLLTRHSLPDVVPACNSYLLATNRTETWMGPSQTITDKINSDITYRISAWVRVGSGAISPQNVDVSLCIDGHWIKGGHAKASADRWFELKGSFKINRKPSKVLVSVQGPSPHIDLMVTGLNIFPVDKKERFNYLKEKIDKVRKHDIILKIDLSGYDDLQSISLKITQKQNSFPLGSCISRANIKNDKFVDFFLRTFNWAVFENELKWYHTESEQGKFNYKDADEMLEFCEKHSIQTRAHCIFWDVEKFVQPWLRSLNRDDLMMSVENRLKELVSRYKGRFKHYDVNNEMLHGSFFQDRLGKDINAYMFRETQKLDPSTVLFVNDYNVEDGCDPKSTPEILIDHIFDLQEQGASVGGIGLQGHISNPDGEIICDTLDKLSILGLPIWFTEFDVVADDEFVRADDLEVFFREAFAHPAVEGVLLWGFWESLMWRKNCHLVDADGKVNEAGNRLLALKQEWLTRVNGQADAQGEFKFRGFLGTYDVEITTPSKSLLRSFVVNKEDSPIVVILR